MAAGANRHIGESMKTYFDFLAYCQPHLSKINEIVQVGLIELDEAGWTMHPLRDYWHKLNPETRYDTYKWLTGLEKLGEFAFSKVAQEIFMSYWFFKDGVHLLECPRDVEEALEQMDLPIGAEDYHQPFPSVGIQLSDRFITLSWNREWRRLWAGVLSDSGGDLFYTTIQEGETIEEGIRRTYEPHDEQRCNVQGDNHERDFRIALNLCMYATNYGMHSIDDNAGHRKRVQDRLAKANKRGDERLAEVNRRELAAIPFRYNVIQNLPIRTQATAICEKGEPTGRTVAPHWRRGHWRKQRVGQGRREIKLTAIPPVLVNADLLLGNVKDTATFFK